MLSLADKYHAGVPADRLPKGGGVYRFRDPAIGAIAAVAALAGATMMAGPVQPAFVQSAAPVNFTALTTSMAPARTGVTATNCLLLAVSSTTITTGYVATGVTDTNSGTWLRGPVQASTLGTTEIWYCLNAGAGTHTLTVATNSGTNGCWLDEFSGVASIGPILDVSAGNSVSSGTITVSLTPSNVNELLYFSTVSTSTQTASPGAPFTTEAGPTLAGAQVAGIAYVAPNNLVSAYAPTWTHTVGFFAAVGIALKGASAPGDVIFNDTAAQNNPAILETQARPDYFDSVIGALAETGTGVLSGCAVSPNTNADFNYQSAAGTVLLSWAKIAVSATTAQAVTAADATNPRRDLIYVTQGGVVTYVAGVANATPCPPTLPLNCVPLAIIDVPANATVLANGTNTANAYVTDKRIMLNFGQGSPSNLLATGAVNIRAETFPRSTAVNTGTSIGTGRLRGTAIWLPAGFTVNNIIIPSGAGGAASTPTHWWFALLDLNGDLLAVTADQTTTAFAASTVKSLAIATTAQGSQSSFTTTYSGIHYIGMGMTATTGILFVTPAVMPGGTGVYSVASTPTLWFDNAGPFSTPPAFPTQVALTITVQSLWAGVN